MTSCFVYTVISDLESIDDLCINPIRRIGSGVYKLMFYLTIVNKNTTSLSLLAGRTVVHSHCHFCMYMPMCYKTTF